VTCWRALRAPVRALLRIGTPMLCWLAAFARSTNSSPASRMILPELAPCQSRSHKTFRSSGQMSA